MGRFRRKRVNCTIHGVDIYNLSPQENKELKRYLTELNADLTERMGREAEKCINEGIELTEDMLQYARMDAISYQAVELEKKKKDWLLRYTSLTSDDFDDEDLVDPNKELKEIMKKLDKVCIKPIVEEIQESLEEIYNLTIKRITKDYGLGD